MTIIQMRYFYEVCQWQNITKAAEHLHVSQPTISVAMQALETETGLNLFHREGRKIIITHDGSKLLGKVKHILDQMDQLEEEINDVSQQHSVENGADVDILSAPDQRCDQIDAVHDDGHGAK